MYFVVIYVLYNSLSLGIKYISNFVNLALIVLLNY